MVILIEDVILELVQYLDIFDVLSVAQSCGVALRASQNHSFWSPHKLRPSIGLAAFLPAERVGPWKSYSGDEIRQAVARMRNLRNRWTNEPVQASHRIHVGKHQGQLEAIAGSRWLYCYFWGRNGLSLRFVDGKTGAATVAELDFDPSGPFERPVALSLEPNRVIMLLSGQNDVELSNLALYEIILSFNENNGNSFLESNATQLQMWKNEPGYLAPSLNREFLVLEADLMDMPGYDVEICHIASRKRWKWKKIHQSHHLTLLDRWCIIVTGTNTETIEVVAIHLPSLLFLPAQTSDGLILPKGTSLITGFEIPPAIIHPYPHTVDIDVSGSSESLQQNHLNCAVMFSNNTRRFIFNLRIEVVAGSPYGNVVYPGQPFSLPTNTELKGQLSSTISTKDGSVSGSSEDEPFPLDYITTDQFDFEVLFSAFNSTNYIKFLGIIELGKGNHIRILDWKAPLIEPIGQSQVEGVEYGGDADLVRSVRDWDIGTGMLLLEGPPLSGGLLEYQVCWF